MANANEDPRVYVRNVAFDLNEAGLRRELGRHDFKVPVRCTFLRQGSWASGKLCSVFLHYATAADARAVAASLNGHCMEGAQAAWECCQATTSPGSLGCRNNIGAKTILTILERTHISDKIFER